jgi:hypothetical protein
VKFNNDNNTKGPQSPYDTSKEHHMNRIRKALAH